MIIYVGYSLPIDWNFQIPETLKEARARFERFYSYRPTNSEDEESYLGVDKDWIMARFDVAEKILSDTGPNGSGPEGWYGAGPFFSVLPLPDMQTIGFFFFRKMVSDGTVMYVSTDSLKNFSFEKEDSMFTEEELRL